MPTILRIALPAGLLAIGLLVLAVVKQQQREAEELLKLMQGRGHTMSWEKGPPRYGPWGEIAPTGYQGKEPARALPRTQEPPERIPMLVLAWIVIVVILLSVFCGAWGYFLALPREREIAGLWAGICFGPLGVVVAALLDYALRCDRCGAGLHSRAQICPACGVQFSTRGTARSTPPPVPASPTPRSASASPPPSRRSVPST